MGSKGRHNVKKPKGYSKKVEKAQNLRSKEVKEDAR